MANHANVISPIYNTLALGTNVHGTRTFTVTGVCRPTIRVITRVVVPLPCSGRVPGVPGLRRRRRPLRVPTWRARLQLRCVTIRQHACFRGRVICVKYMCNGGPSYRSDRQWYVLYVTPIYRSFFPRSHGVEDRRCHPYSDYIRYKMWPLV